MLKIGDKAPDFTLPTDTGEITLSSLNGKKVVVYFYPKDNTSGCTQEACDFRDAYSRLCVKAHVIGISKDSPKSHQNFKAKYQLPFTLASDIDGGICEKYGVWVLKSMYGRSYHGIERATFLIDENGNILKIWRKVSVKGHVEDVMATIEN
ncbi:MAG: thioredoxin-dependent thiol peroxidase [Alphaproteobacteria bacterium]|nr:thioredoxin-dependent thiol peroxidase [Alphaproteobacteria bacterium]OJV47535.1 MAG: peroxiredoxin [Alphaproteobacteria bacterium 43-37]